MWGERLISSPLPGGRAHAGAGFIRPAQLTYGRDPLTYGARSADVIIACRCMLATLSPAREGRTRCAIHSCERLGRSALRVWKGGRMDAGSDRSVHVSKASVSHADEAGQSSLEREQLSQDRETLDEIMRSISHDVSGPIRAVASFSRLLREAYAERLDPEGTRYLELLDAGASEIARCGSGWLRVARVITRGREPARVDTVAAVGQATALCHSLLIAAEARVDVEALPAVCAAPHQVVEVLRELVQNAARHGSKRPLRIRVTGTRRGRRVELAVSDDGIGMDASQLPALVRLSRGESSDVATAGFGLAVCDRIVRRAGGTLRVESAPGQGVRALFDLPADVRAEAQGQSGRPPEAQPRA